MYVQERNDSRDFPCLSSAPVPLSICIYICVYIDFMHVYVIVDDLMTWVFCSDFEFYASYARAGDLCFSIRWRDNGALRVA